MKMQNKSPQQAKPEIGKRILPLLDIVFILLAFFIVLPHGVKSNEILEISDLKKRNRDVKQELEYYRWKYGSNKDLDNKVHKILNITIKNNKFYVAKDLLSKTSWQQELKKKIEISNTTFVIIKIQIDQGDNSSEVVDSLQDFLYTLNVLHIAEVDENW